MNFPGTAIRLASLVGILALSVVGSGCSGGKPKALVTGTVLVDGKPADGATIFFHPKDDPAGMTATGTVDVEGHYTVTSALEKGITVGSYDVTVIWPDQSKQPTPAQIMMGTAEDGPDLLKGKYAKRGDSQLQAEISTSTKELPPFELKAP
jgi:hypothetical protein